VKKQCIAVLLAACAAVFLAAQEVPVLQTEDDTTPQFRLKKRRTWKFLAVF
jgi:hypothetical protein